MDLLQQISAVAMVLALLGATLWLLQRKGLDGAALHGARGSSK